MGHERERNLDIKERESQQNIAIVTGSKDLRKGAGQALMTSDVQETLFGKPKPIIDSKELELAYEETAGDIAQTLSLDSKDQVHFFNVAEPTVGRFFIYAATEREKDKKGFIKVGRNEKTNEALKNESAATQVAEQLGYPVIPIITPYTKTAKGRSVVEFEFVDFMTEGRTAHNKLESRLELPSRYGQHVAETLLPHFAKPIPPEIDITDLRLADWSFESTNIFLNSLRDEQQRILEKPEVVNHAIENRSGKSGVGQLEELFDELDSSLPNILFHGEEQSRGQNFFCANDIALHNALFPHEYGPGKRYKTPVVFFDWEWAGWVKNPLLAELVTYGNFFARTDPNIAMQQEFLGTVLKENPFGDRDKTYEFLRSAMIARTVFAAHFYMDPDNPRHHKSVSGLKNLIPNIERLEATYKNL